VFTFVTQWVSGLLSNYKRVISHIVIHKLHEARLLPFLSRPQLDAVDNLTHKPLLVGSTIFKKKRRAYISRVPSIALSTLDSYIWANECNCLRIPSIQLCDTQSLYQKITYPIIANQRSVSITHLIVHLFAEACSMALIHEHLFFRSFSKHLRVCKRNIMLKVKSHSKRQHYRLWFKRGTFNQNFNRFQKRGLHDATYSYPHHSNMSSPTASYSRFAYHPLKPNLKMISTVSTFIVNKHRPAFLLPHVLLLQLSKRKEIFISTLLQSILYTTIKQFRTLVKDVQKRVNKAYKQGKGRLVWQYIKEHKKAAVKELKLWIIDNIGFFKALFLKRKFKVKYLTELPIRRRYLDHHDIYKLLLGLPEYYASLKELFKQIIDRRHHLNYNDPIVEGLATRKPEPARKYVPTIVLEWPVKRTEPLVPVRLTPKWL